MKCDGNVARKRFVVLKGADFQFTTLSYILYSKKRGLSPAAHEFLGLLRQAKRIPDSKNLDEIVGLHEGALQSLLTKRRKSPLVALSDDCAADGVARLDLVCFSQPDRFCNSDSRFSVPGSGNLPERFH